MKRKTNINISTILHGVFKLGLSSHFYPKLGSFGFLDSTHLQVTATEAPSA
jgi:hypothetical protein